MSTTLQEEIPRPQRHYLDHAATTPVRESAMQAWVNATRMLDENPGNPAALHSGGRTARRMLDDARERVGAALGADLHEVVFTSGATEADALAVAGGARGARAADERRTGVLVSRIEHDAVGDQREVLEPDGFQWRLLPLDRNGVSVIDADAVHEGGSTTALASMSLVCSEIGTLQPVDVLVAALAGTAALVHTDAAQAVGCLDVDFHRLGVDLLSIGGHKIGAPVGTGALLVRRGLSLITDRPGGGQERKLRSGTPDVAGAVALAVALEETVAERSVTVAHLSALRDRLLAGLPARVTPTIPASVATTPAIVHLSLPTHHPEALLMAMDAAGVMVSAGSACHAGVTRPSQIVMEMGRDESAALGVLRVSMGAMTTETDVDALLGALPHSLAAARALDGRDAGRTRTMATPTSAGAHRSESEEIPA